MSVLSAYRLLTKLLRPAVPAFLHWRESRGKEDHRRIGERLGYASIARPAGRLAWLHGASVGEGLALLPVVERLTASGFRVLVTSGTVTSAAILASRLPPGAQHQYVPVDAPLYLRRFLDHWEPDLVMVAESEIWPNMICAVHERGIPFILVNARMSPRSFQRWLKFPGFIGDLLSRMDLCLAQTHDDAMRLMQLGAPRVQVCGNLKFDVPAPPFSQSALAEMSAAIGNRPVWFAASTHDGEEEIALEVHRRLLTRFPNLLTIVAPRHAARGLIIADLALRNGIEPSLRSRGDAIAPATGFYIADTMGEMGLFYRLTSIVFMGKSLGGAHGGQNPIEPAKLGCVVLHGPDVGNFEEVYRHLTLTNGATEILNAAMLERALQVFLSDPALLRRNGRAAKDAVENLSGATDCIMQTLEPWLLQMQAENR
jgi:3-deoxy-D-manno-octulosonic-acid transferase